MLRATDAGGAARYRLPGIVREHGAALGSGHPEVDPEDAAYAGHWQLLTPREREVAGLVARGLTNREIAACLVVSKRTVDAHLEHILGKLGYNSRIQVAALASHEQAVREESGSVPAPRTEAAGSGTEPAASGDRRCYSPVLLAGARREGHAAHDLVVARGPLR